MNKQQHPSNNHVLGAPAGWDHGAIPCGALAVTLSEIEGVSAVQSFWKPTPLELANLLHGGVVVLTVLGGGMPPVSLDVIPG